MDGLVNARDSKARTTPMKMAGTKSSAGSVMALYKSCDNCRAGKRKCDGFNPCRCTLYYCLELVNKICSH